MLSYGMLNHKLVQDGENDLVHRKANNLSRNREVYLTDSVYWAYTYIESPASCSSWSPGDCHSVVIAVNVYASTTNHRTAVQWHLIIISRTKLFTCGINKQYYGMWLRNGS